MSDPFLKFSSSAAIVEAEGVAVADSKIDVTLLPPNHWGGSGAAPDFSRRLSGLPIPPLT